MKEKSKAIASTAINTPRNVKKTSQKYLVYFKSFWW